MEKTLFPRFSVFRQSSVLNLYYSLSLLLRIMTLRINE